MGGFVVIGGYKKATINVVLFFLFIIMAPDTTQFISITDFIKNPDDKYHVEFDNSNSQTDSFLVKKTTTGDRIRIENVFFNGDITDFIFEYQAPVFHILRLRNFEYSLEGDDTSNFFEDDDDSESWKNTTSKIFDFAEAQAKAFGADSVVLHRDETINIDGKPFPLTYYFNLFDAEPDWQALGYWSETDKSQTLADIAHKKIRLPSELKDALNVSEDKLYGQVFATSTAQQKRLLLEYLQPLYPVSVRLTKWFKNMPLHLLKQAPLQQPHNIGFYKKAYRVFVIFTDGDWKFELQSTKTCKPYVEMYTGNKTSDVQFFHDLTIDPPDAGCPSGNDANEHVLLLLEKITQLYDCESMEINKITLVFRNEETNLLYLQNIIYDQQRNFLEKHGYKINAAGDETEEREKEMTHRKKLVETPVEDVLVDHPDLLRQLKADDIDMSKTLLQLLIHSRDTLVVDAVNAVSKEHVYTKTFQASTSSAPGNAKRNRNRSRFITKS